MKLTQIYLCVDLIHIHVIDLDVSVVWGRDQELGVGGEGEGSDGHGVT